MRGCARIVPRAVPTSKSQQPSASHSLRCAGAVIACLALLSRVLSAGVAMQLVACILPSVTQQPAPPAVTSSENATTPPASDFSTSVAPDSGSAAAPVSEPSATADAGMSMTEPSASAADRNAGSAGMSAMSIAGRGARAAMAGAPSAGRSGPAAPAQPLARGMACRSAEECASGYCADGVCCNATCEGECEQCNTFREEGRCIKLDGEPDFDSCPNSIQICARGVCRLPNNAICAADNECASGVCGDSPSGRCCAMRCPICHNCTNGETCEPISGPGCGGNRVCMEGSCLSQ